MQEKNNISKKIEFSATIICFNEEKNIARCIESLLTVTDDIIVLDSFSTDRTKSICLNYPVKFIQHKFDGHIQQKNRAITFAKNDYIISLDADEALDITAQKTLLKLKNNWKHDGYFIARSNFYCGQYIKWSGWNPDRKLRIFDRRKAFWGGINPHDSIQFHQPETKTQILKGSILHHVHKTYDEHSLKVHKFSSIAAQEYFKLGKTACIFKIFYKTAWTFFKAYIIRLGILDGFNGFMISSLSAYTCFLKYAKLRQLVKNSKIN